MTKEKINRINELAKKAKENGLTEEEKQERDLLRKEYINDVKRNFKRSLNGYYFKK